MNQFGDLFWVYDLTAPRRVPSRLGMCRRVAIGTTSLIPVFGRRLCSLALESREERHVSSERRRRRGLSKNRSLALCWALEWSNTADDLWSHSSRVRRHRSEDPQVRCCSSTGHHYRIGWRSLCNRDWGTCRPANQVRTYGQHFRTCVPYIEAKVWMK
nr:hypothetical protein CFP56_50412 [Quercus suber]